MRDKNDKSARLSLSVAIITKNEEEKLPRCLKSVSFADEIVVVDSGSSDRTVEIAKGFGCRVFVEDWKGYGPQKNSAVLKCSHKWVLLLDADERVPDETMKAIETALENRGAAAYSFRRKNFFHGKWVKHSGNWPDRNIRLVDKDKGSFRGMIHERWATDGLVKELDDCILHYGFSNYSDLLKTMNRYSTMTAEEQFSSGRKTGPLSAVSHGASMFLRNYLFKGALLGGLDGLVIAMTKAGGSFFKYAKLLELQRKK